MELYKFGKVVSMGKIYIIFEWNYAGYIAYVSRPNEFIKDKVIKLYIYEHETEYTKAMFGFPSLEEKELFEDLISINGIGPKVAISILQDGYKHVVETIASGDEVKISKLKGVGLRIASDIKLELTSKFVQQLTESNGTREASEIAGSLKTLGFSQQQIDYAVKNLGKANSLEELVENAIKLIGSKA